jgi:hypothetical protein
MTISIPSQGTHISDGIRTGPILNPQYVSGGNVLTPSVMVSSASETQAPGIFNTPLALMDFFPYPSGAATLVGAGPLAAAGYLALGVVNLPGITVMPSFGGVTGPGGHSIIKLDVPRNVSVTSTGNDSAVNFTVFGWDQYGSPMAEQITGSNAGIATGKKAFLYIRAVYASAAVAANASVGTGNSFGLPYFCPFQSYLGIPFWNELPELPNTVPIGQTFLANNPLATDGVTAIVTVTVPSTAALFNGDLVTIAGATATGGITAPNLNIVAPIAVTGPTTFTYLASALSTAAVAAGGGAGVSYLGAVSQTPGIFAPAVELTATATTGDVRGTYTPSSAANGIKHLFINFYAPSADGRKYRNASQNTINLLANSLSTTNLSNVVTVLSPDHQLTNGEFITISGATATGGILAPNLNLTRVPVTVLSPIFFSFVAGAAATATAAGGGTGMFLTPAKGNLYEIPVGRFGVAQYSIPLF